MKQERDHIEGGRLAKLLGGVLVIAVAGIAVASCLMGPRPVLPASTPAPRTIGSIEQTQIYRTAVGLDLHDAGNAALESWSWVDRDGGIGSIPIDDAMRLVGEKR